MSGGGARRSPDDGRLRRATLVVAILAIGAAIVGQGSSRPDPWRGTVGGRPSVGQCHRVGVAEEGAAPSDPSAPVPCTEGHETEVIGVVDLPADLAAAARRPTASELDAVTPDLDCGHEQVARLVGSGELDLHWFITTEVRFPTPRQWDDGARWARCDARVNRLGAVGPNLSEVALRGIMSTPASEDVRRCVETSVVPCSHLHWAEIVEIGTIPIDRSDPGRAWMEHEVCPYAAIAFVGADLDDLGLEARVVDLADGRSFCVVALPAGSEPVTGTWSVMAGSGESPS